MRPPRQELDPPTIGQLKTVHGVTGVRVDCGCGHRAVVSFDAIGRPDTTPFTALRFKCSKCGGAKVSTMPDWPPPKRGL